jgi:predicted RNA binding protein YcfA (HicA-like mRNA interferase family)
LAERVLSGRSDANIRFTDLLALLRRLGFDERTRGSHHIFTRDDLDEIVNLQPHGSQAKPYQVRQVRQLILRYELEEMH